MVDAGVLVVLLGTIVKQVREERKYISFFFIVANYCTPDCLNGGECTNGRCRCSYGFTGNHCQTGKR